MGFHKRYLSEESIKSFAVSLEFRDFEIYLTHADAYMINGDWTYKFFKDFEKLENNSNERKLMYKKIKNEATKTNSIL